MSGFGRIDDEKVRDIKFVQLAAEAAMSAVIDYLKNSSKPVATEAHEIIDRVLASRSCESPHGHIVASGEEAVEPHEVGKKEIDKNTPVVIDIYPKSKDTGFYADMTRTVSLGEPSLQIKKMHEAILEAMNIAEKMAKPGVLGCELQEVVDDYFSSVGFLTSGKGKEFRYAEGFVHALGHGVGQEVHMDPKLSPLSNDVLKVGDVITLEPGLYYKGIGGVRVEDMYLVTEYGLEKLTNFSRELVI